MNITKEELEIFKISKRKEKFQVEKHLEVVNKKTSSKILDLKCFLRNSFICTLQVKQPIKN